MSCPQLQLHYVTVTMTHSYTFYTHPITDGHGCPHSIHGPERSSMATTKFTTGSTDDSHRMFKLEKFAIASDFLVKVKTLNRF